LIGGARQRGLVLDRYLCNGEGHNTIIQPGALKRDEEKLNQYCYEHGDTTVTDAVKNMGLGK
jgi:hypothetical protein